MLYRLERDFREVEHQRDLFKKAFQDKEKDCEELKRELSHFKLKLQNQDSAEKRKYTTNSSSVIKFPPSGFLSSP